MSRHLRACSLAGVPSGSATFRGTRSLPDVRRSRSSSGDAIQTSSPPCYAVSDSGMVSAYLHDAALNGVGQTYAKATAFLLNQLDNFTMAGLSTVLEQYFPQIPAENRVPFIYGVTCSAQVVARSFYTWQGNHNSYDSGMRRAADRAYSAFAFWNYGLRDESLTSRPVISATDLTGAMSEGRVAAETTADTLNERTLDHGSLWDQHESARPRSNNVTCAVASTVPVREAMSSVGGEPMSHHLISHGHSAESLTTGAQDAGVHMLDYYCLPVRPGVITEEFNAGTDIIMASIQASDIIPVPDELLSTCPSSEILQPSMTHAPETAALESLVCQAAIASEQRMVATSAAVMDSRTPAITVEASTSGIRQPLVTEQPAIQASTMQSSCVMVELSQLSPTHSGTPIDPAPNAGSMPTQRHRDTDASKREHRSSLFKSSRSHSPRTTERRRSPIRSAASRGRRISLQEYHQLRLHHQRFEQLKRNYKPNYKSGYRPNYKSDNWKNR